MYPQRISKRGQLGFLTFHPNYNRQTTAWDRDKYLGNLFYDVAKTAINRMAYGVARELRPYGIAALALAPGSMRTERVLAAFEAHPEIEETQGRLSAVTESPEYAGRAVVALATDPRIMEKSGRTFRVGELAQEYGFTDIDGRTVPPFDLPEEG